MANKKTRVLLTVLAIIMAVISLLLLIVSPVGGMVGLVLAVLVFVYVKKSKTAEAADAAAREIRMARTVARTSLTPKYRVVGIIYRSENLASLLPDGTGYARPSNRARKYYQYDVYEGSCTLEPEPDNEADPNAVKVVVNKVWHIGYIPKEDTEDAKKLIADGAKFRIRIYGGPYKRFDETAGRWVKVDNKFYADVYVEGE